MNRPADEFLTDFTRSKLPSGGAVVAIGRQLCTRSVARSFTEPQIEVCGNRILKMVDKAEKVGGFVRVHAVGECCVV